MGGDAELLELIDARLAAVAELAGGLTSDGWRRVVGTLVGDLRQRLVVAALEARRRGTGPTEPPPSAA